ncbi:hypothetical protein HYX13_02100 [Candidatus Woesearchaeota archaeon]|nr:hypothetical protein [Candidatus Woesearchaeota archaeon]
MLTKSSVLKYYKRKEIQDALIANAKNKEVGLRFGQIFGKRPDTLTYPREIIDFTMQSISPADWKPEQALSFHVSEELWENPLHLSTGKSRKELDELRIGWDLVLDVDCKIVDYSKLCAHLIVRFLQYCGVKDISCKFSVTGDTPILAKINDKIMLLSIKKVIDLIKKNKKAEVLSLNEQGYVHFSKITDYLEHKEVIYEIWHDSSKLPIRATKYHSVFVWDEGNLIPKAVESLKEGDNLITFRKADKISRKGAKYFEWEFEYLHKKIKRSIKIKKKLLILLGYYLSEGHLTRSINQIGFSFNINEIDYITECVDLLKELTGRKISIRHPNNNSTQILIHSKEWYAFFEKVCGKGAKNKHVPDFAWKLPKEDFEKLLLGYIRGDGYKRGEYSITIKSVSHQLIKEFTWLCNLNGISCSINQDFSKEHYMPQGTLFKGSHVFTINIPKSELTNMEFFRGKNKYSPYPNGKTLPIDGLKKVYQQVKPKLFNRHRAEQMTLSKKSANLERIKKVLQWFEKYKSREYDIESKKIVDNYFKLFKNDVMTLEIKRIIMKNEEEVYDISVEKTERFFGGCYPILLHNSGNKGFHIGVPFDAFPQEVGNTLTKNLFPEAPRKIAFYIKENIAQELGKNILAFEKGNFAAVREKVQLTNEELLRYEENEFGDKIPHLNVESFLEIDTVLLASRHLYRMAYSLHEKSGLVSLPIPPEKILEFQKAWATPENILAKLDAKEPLLLFLERKNSIDADNSYAVYGPSSDSSGSSSNPNVKSLKV